MIEHKDLEHLRIKLFTTDHDPRMAPPKKSRKRKTPKLLFLISVLILIAVLSYYVFGPELTGGKADSVAGDTTVNTDYVKNYKVLNSFMVPGEADDFQRK